MALQDIPINAIITLLLTNPDAQTFPMSGPGYGPDVPRSVLQNEVNTRPLATSIDSNPSRPIKGLHAIGGSNKNKD